MEFNGDLSYQELLGGLSKTALVRWFKRKLSEDKQTTVLARIEMRENNRPLTHIDDDVDHSAPVLIYGGKLGPMSVHVENIEDAGCLGSDEVNSLCIHTSAIFLNKRKVYLTSQKKKMELKNPLRTSI